MKIICKNKRAKFDYEIIETLEAGIILYGWEVKSVCQGQARITESYIDSNEDMNALILINSDIAPYKASHKFEEQERNRHRKLLLKKRDISKWTQAIQKKGLTIIPLDIHINEKGLVKINIALARGKNTFDKRQTIKERDWNRKKSRLEF